MALPHHDRGADAPRDPEYDGFRIDTLWAYTQVGGDNEEGIIAYFDGATWIPAIASDRNRLESLVPYAQAVADATGRPVKLSAFTTRTDLEDVTPA